MSNARMGTAVATTLAMLAFAGNSLLGRLALGPGRIDAASYATVRVLSGALVLALIVVLRARRVEGPAAAPTGRLAPFGRGRADWFAALMLFAYMASFAFSYRTLAAGTGALILFGAVQLTMIFAAMRAGERLRPSAWTGLAIAISGLVVLVSPGISAPDPLGAVEMGLAGIAWGLYSLRGRGAADPLGATAANFVRAVPFVLALSLICVGDIAVSASGLALAVLSGAVTSGLGYAVWYAALGGLRGSQAAVVQLTVPVIAALGGVALLAEAMTPRLAVASLATVGGVWLVLSARAERRAV